MSSHVIRARPPRGVADRIRLETDAERLAPYLEDAAHVPGGRAAAVAAPGDERQVADLLRHARSVLAIGAQSSLTGGATPRGEVILSSSRLRSIAVGAGVVTAGAGVSLTELEAALAAAGVRYPPVPTYLGATVGGIVSTNAAGAATFKYGTTREWVEGLTVVLADGGVLDVRRGEVVAGDSGFEVHLESRIARVPVPSYRLPDVPKVSAGYFAAPGMDLVDLFVGSEGTLGVVTSVTLRTLPRDRETVQLLVFCPTRDLGLRLVSDIRDRSRRTWVERDPHGIDVCAIEQMDRRCLDLLVADGVDRALSVPVPADAAWALLVTLEVPRDTDAAAAHAAVAGALDGTAPDSGLVRLCRCLASAGLLDRTELAAPEDRARQHQWLMLREAVPAGVNRRIGLAQRTIDPGIQKIAADVIVPFDRLPELLERWDRETAVRGLDGPVWGHVSDGNLHPNVIPHRLADLEAGRDAVLAIGRAAIALGGAPCAEHGVGRNRIKQQLVRELYGPAGIDAMRAVKRALDPEWKLAPGVLGLEIS
ncbi:MAG: FAD-binding oxidoreductase [Vicinamibacterales bacterium]